MITFKSTEKLRFAEQSVKYIITGGASFCTDYLLYWIFSLFLHYQAATYIGLIAGLGVNYALSKLWVFKNNLPVSKRELFSFLLFTAFGFALTGIGMYVGVDFFKANDKVVKLIVAVIVFVINFAARKYIIFRNN